MLVLLSTVARGAPGSPARSSSRRRGAWSRAGSRWTHELVAYTLDRFHARHLRTPTLRELRAGLDEMPSYATIKRMYGNTSAMFEYQAIARGRPVPNVAACCTSINATVAVAFSPILRARTRSPASRTRSAGAPAGQACPQMSLAKARGARRCAPGEPRQLLPPRRGHPPG